MSRKKAKVAQDVRDGFVRGFLAAGLLAAMETRGSAAASPAPGSVLRRALRAGGAVAVGTAAAAGLRHRDPATAALAVAAGAVLVLTAANGVDPTMEGVP